MSRLRSFQNGNRNRHLCVAWLARQSTWRRHDCQVREQSVVSNSQNGLSGSAQQAPRQGELIDSSGIVDWLFLTALASNVTAVCASALPFSLAPVCITIAVLSNIFPLKTAVVPIVVFPATCQKMFFACAPPARITLLPELIFRVCAIWNIQTAFGPPERVTFVGIVTVELHL